MLREGGWAGDILTETPQEGQQVQRPNTARGPGPGVGLTVFWRAALLGSCDPPPLAPRSGEQLAAGSDGLEFTHRGRSAS